MGNKCSACCRCACCTNGKAHGHISSSGSVYTKRFVGIWCAPVWCDMCDVRAWNGVWYIYFEFFDGHRCDANASEKLCKRTCENIFVFFLWNGRVSFHLLFTRMTRRHVKATNFKLFQLTSPIRQTAVICFLFFSGFSHPFNTNVTVSFRSFFSSIETVLRK